MKYSVYGDSFAVNGVVSFNFCCCFFYFESSCAPALLHLWRRFTGNCHIFYGLMVTVHMIKSAVVVVSTVAARSDGEFIALVL